MTQAHAKARKSPWNPTAQSEKTSRLKSETEQPFTPETILVVDRMPGGHHVIEVRARDANFNIEATPLKAGFTVILPVWQQAWFITVVMVAILLFIGLLVLFIRQRIRHVLELESVKIRFFTHLSHELKTPLSLIMGPVERLQNEIGDSQHQHYLSLIKSNSQRLLFLVNQLLDFRKFQINKLDYKPDEGDFITYIRSCLAVFNGWTAEKGQTIAFESSMRHFAFPFPHEIFHKIIDNLVNNAVKYTPRGGRITVRIEKLRTDDGQLFGVMEVLDTGPGVPERDKAAVFEPFYRSTANEELAEGSGIGLAFVKELVASIDETIELISPVNTADAAHPGCCFRVTFPIQSVCAGTSVESLADVPDVQSDVGAEASTKVSPEGLILLVEDNFELREFLCAELRSLSAVETADSMESGFRKAKESIPDVVISDVIMQDRSGFDLCRELKNDPHTSHVPVVLLTALRSDEHKRQAYESGADDFLTKPVSPEILRLKLRNILETQQHSRQRVRQQFVDDNRLTGRSQADQAFLDKVRAMVDKELSNEQFDVNMLAELMGFSRSAFYRKFSSLTDLSPASYIRTTRLRKAAKWLAEGGKSVSEIAFDAGFSDAGYFSRLFKDEFKCSPSEFVRKSDDPAV